MNAGGLVVVIIPDSGSRPPKDIKVTYGREYKKLGELQGSQDNEGTPLAGGGYTLYLLKPLNTGDSTVTVSYTEADGNKVKTTYKLKIEKAE